MQNGTKTRDDSGKRCEEKQRPRERPRFLARYGNRSDANNSESVLILCICSDSNNTETTTERVYRLYCKQMERQNSKKSMQGNLLKVLIKVKVIAYADDICLFFVELDLLDNRTITRLPPPRPKNRSYIRAASGTVSCPELSLPQKKSLWNIYFNVKTENRKQKTEKENTGSCV